MVRDRLKVLPSKAAVVAGVYEVWIDARDTVGNAADTKVGTLNFG